MVVSFVDGVHNFLENKTQIRRISSKPMCHICVPARVGQSSQEDALNNKSSYNTHEPCDDFSPDLFGRYIDDRLGTASCTRADLERFINYVNGFHHALKFIWEISETSVSFLDISVSINGDALATSVSSKPTDSHSYLFVFLPH